MLILFLILSLLSLIVFIIVLFKSVKSSSIFEKDYSSEVTNLNFPKNGNKKMSRFGFHIEGDLYTAFKLAFKGDKASVLLVLMILSFLFFIEFLFIGITLYLLENEEGGAVLFLLFIILIPITFILNLIKSYRNRS